MKLPIKKNSYQEQNPVETPYTVKELFGVILTRDTEYQHRIVFANTIQPNVCEIFIT